MRQESFAGAGGGAEFVSKLPVRQESSRNPLTLGGGISKLPVRQESVNFILSIVLPISKLPVRQESKTPI